MAKSKRGGARPGAGAKPKPASQLRRNRVVLLLTDQELRDVRKAAGKARASDWVREVALSAAQRRLRAT